MYWLPPQPPVPPFATIFAITDGLMMFPVDGLRYLGGNLQPKAGIPKRACKDKEDGFGMGSVDANVRDNAKSLKLRPYLEPQVMETLKGPPNKFTWYKNKIRFTVTNEKKSIPGWTLGIIPRKVEELKRDLKPVGKAQGEGSLGRQ
ncbi:hypothetical protein Tco_0386478 [Tanacetum coccineum]